MNEKITDAKAIERVEKKVNSWINEASGIHSHEQNQIISVVELTEYPIYRLTYKAEIQTRRVVPFSRPDSTKPSSAPSITSPDQIDVWSVESNKVSDFVTDNQQVEIAQSLSASFCRSCETSGKISCPDCRGQTANFCSQCHGDGKIFCPVCKRTKTVVCQRCNGRGKIYNEIKKTYDGCHNCGGKGSIKCTHCENGYLTCSLCGGKGRVSCKKCNDTGEIECEDCSGKGQTVSGFAVQIVSYPNEEKMEMENTDIPEGVLKGISLKTVYQQFLEVDDSEEVLRNSAKYDKLPKEIKTNFNRLKSLACEPAKNRRILGRFILEKKFMYLVDFKFGGYIKKVWIGDSGPRVVCEDKVLEDIHFDTMGDLNWHIENDDISGAIDICGKIEKIKAFAPQIREAKARIRKKLLSSYFSGALAGLVVFSCISIPILYAWRSKSLHIGFLINMALIANIVVSFLAGAIIYAINLKVLDKNIKRFFAGAGAVAIALLFFYGWGSLIKLDPATSLDANQMTEEHARYFPFGLRTLTSKEDIKFLENMISRYSPTGVDMTSVKKELDWLKEKLKKDEENIHKIEQTAKEIKKSEMTNQNKRRVKYPRKHSKIYIR